MQFDAYGDLWISVGDNMQTDNGPGNTADLRGSILRIHPDDMNAKGYTIPKGNFGEHAAAGFQAAGNAALAQQYADTAKVKAEIYVKGARNAYSMTVDPVRRWLTWGDVGPDQGRKSEEYNLVKEPYFTGWPYFAGEQDMAGVAPYGTSIPAGSTRANPVNTTTTKGAKQLPAVRDPMFAKAQSCAMAGPIFRYDGSNTLATQFPPQPNRKWLVSDCNGNYAFHLISLDSLGNAITANIAIFAQRSLSTIVDMKQGPDGSLYYVNWGNGIFRVDYTGQCKDPALLPEKTGCADPKATNYDANLPKAFHDQRLCLGVVGIRDGLASRPGIHIGSRSIAIDSRPA